MVMSRPRTKTLAELAGEADFRNATSLAEFIGVSDTVIQRAWHDHDWPTKMHGINLVQLCTSVPVIQEYCQSLTVRVLHVHLHNARHAVQIEPETLKRLREAHSDQYLAKAIDVLARLDRAQTDEALFRLVPLLANFWQRDRGRALEALLVPAAGNQVDIGIAVDRARDLLELLTESKAQRGTPGPRPPARQVLSHYLTMRGDIGPIRSASETSRDRLVDLRCTVMAAITKGDDLDLARWYQRQVRKDQNLADVERWMFPAWTGDVDQNSNPSVAIKVPLVATGAEVVHEIMSPKYPSSYIWYLATTYLPIALQVDDTIGLRRLDIQVALKERMESPLTSEEARDEIARIDARMSKV